MQRRTVFLFCTLLAAAGCSAAGSKSATHAMAPSPLGPLPPKAVEEPAPPPDEPADPAVSLTPPAGWMALPSERLPHGIAGAYFSRELMAKIVVSVATSDESATADAQAVAKAMHDGHRVDTVSKVELSEDGKSAWCGIAKGDFLGVITVRHLGPGGHLSLIFMGIWYRGNSRWAETAYDALVKSAAAK